MKFEPLTEEQLQIQSLVPEGIYNYQVIKSEDAVSRAGNDHIKFTLKIWDNDGREHMIFTNLALIKLLKHFCDVNGMQEDYKSGNIPADKCSGMAGGKVIVGIEGEKPDGKGGMYRAKNIVKDYISTPQGSLMKPLPDMKNEFMNDEIPF